MEGVYGGSYIYQFRHEKEEQVLFTFPVTCTVGLYLISLTQLLNYNDFSNLEFVVWPELGIFPERLFYRNYIPNAMY